MSGVTCHIGTGGRERKAQPTTLGRFGRDRLGADARDIAVAIEEYARDVDYFH